MSYFILFAVISNDLCSKKAWTESSLELIAKNMSIINSQLFVATWTIIMEIVSRIHTIRGLQWNNRLELSVRNNGRVFVPFFWNYTDNLDHSQDKSNNMEEYFGSGD